ncbi:hypothetical protein AAFC00_000047 [Neodothiora populina]|uniref:AB hydrolase-1 domain-containing protein n=1 Tax=Neodothiora populina TaxID=2781224 RepID=A0ABR3P1K3_9PEZI
MLKDKISLFIPELPGYGISTPSKDPSRSAVAAALLETSHALFPSRPIILGGHDRGARLCHRIAVTHAGSPSSSSASSPPSDLYTFSLLGLILLDIVPTLTQWQSFTSPTVSSKYYHWAFLTSPPAIPMLLAYGGDRFAHSLLSNTSGPDASAVAACQSDSAWELYEALHAKKEYIEGAVADYSAAVHPEPQEQRDEQDRGQKIAVPLLVMWSLGKLGKMHGDVGRIWKEWVGEGVEVQARGVGGGVGHYLAEEAADVVGRAVGEFVESVRGA